MRYWALQWRKDRLRSAGSEFCAVALQRARHWRDGALAMERKAQRMGVGS